MKRIFLFAIAMLALPSLALADTFALTTSAVAAGNMYTAKSSNPMGCMNIGANTAFLALDGTAATTTNGLELQANGGWANINPANAAVSGISSGGNTTVVCYPGVMFTAGSTNPASAAAGTFRSWHSGSSNAVVSNSVANFIPFDGVAAAQATNEGDVSTVVSNVATVKNMKCVLTTAAGVVTVAGGTSYVIALDQNLVASAETCTILAGASSCTDTNPAHAITTAIGDQLDYLVTPSGTPTALVVKCAAETTI